jgi:NADPH:quinone reductase-like Zn-dependent oxidoreductase
MKAITYRRYGPPEVLQLEEVEKPIPADDEVLVKLHAATVFTGDCEMRGFKFPPSFWLPLRLFIGIVRPKRPVLGQEFSGVVEAIGKDVTRFSAGDAVFGPSGGWGAYAQYICLCADKPMIHKPENTAHDAAATVPTGGLNALHFIRKAALKPGQKILINGAGSSIGTVAVQLAKAAGAEICAVDSAIKLDMLRAIGADHVIDYTREDFTKNGVIYDVILDVVGKSHFSRSLRALTPEGRYLLANPRVIPMLRGVWTNKTSARKVMFALAGETLEDVQHLANFLADGTLKPVIDRHFALEDMVAAHRYVETGQKLGNVVITF